MNPFQEPAIQDLSAGSMIREGILDGAFIFYLRNLRMHSRDEKEDAPQVILRYLDLPLALSFH